MYYFFPRVGMQIISKLSLTDDLLTFMNKTTLDELIRGVDDVKSFLNQTCKSSAPWLWQTTSLESFTKTQYNFLHIIRLPKQTPSTINRSSTVITVFHFVPLHAGEHTHSLCISKQMVRDRYWYSHANWLIMEVIYLNWERNLPGVKNDINLLYD